MLFFEKYITNNYSRKDIEIIRKSKKKFNISKKELNNIIKISGIDIYAPNIKYVYNWYKKDSEGRYYSACLNSRCSEEGFCNLITIDDMILHLWDAFL